MKTQEIRQKQTLKGMGVHTYEIRGFPTYAVLTEDDALKMIGAPVEVMTANEAGARNLPMTGDYDLLAVCTSMGRYGSLNDRRIVKPGIRLNVTAPRHRVA